MHWARVVRPNARLTIREIREIRESLGISVGTFYAYFPGGRCALDDDRNSSEGVAGR